MDDAFSKEQKKELEKLTQENDALAKALGKTTIERDWAVGKLKSLDLSNKKILVDSKLTSPTKTSQCKMLGISRATHYYQPRPMHQRDIKILHDIDEIYTDNSEYGYRLIHRQLPEDGHSIGKDRVLKYMGVLGIQALYPTKKKLTSLKNSAIYILISYNNSEKIIFISKLEKYNETNRILHKPVPYFKGRKDLFSSKRPFAYSYHHNFGSCFL